MKRLAYRFLLIRQGAVGDTLLLSPLIQRLRALYPTAAIDLLGHKERCDLLVGPSGASAAYAIDALPFHTIYDEQAAIADSLRDWLAHYTHIVFYTANPNAVYAEKLRVEKKQWVSVWKALPEAGAKPHITTHYAQALAEWIDSEHLPNPTIELTPSEKIWAEIFLRRAGIDREQCLLIGFHVGAGSKTKCAAPQYFQTVAQALSKHAPIHLLLSQGPADKAAVASFHRQRPETFPVTVLQDLTLRRLAGVLAFCDFFMGNDSGVTHIAAAAGCPAIALFTASEPQIWRPLGPWVKVVELR